MFDTATWLSSAVVYIFDLCTAHTLTEHRRDGGGGGGGGGGGDDDDDDDDDDDTITDSGACASG